MGNIKKKKFYMPGTLGVKGTLLSLRTQPYYNGVVFNPGDPITSFRYLLGKLNYIIQFYEYMKEVPGLLDAYKECYSQQNITQEELTSLKLLVDFLVESPTEINLREQLVDEDIIVELGVHNGD